MRTAGRAVKTIAAERGSDRPGRGRRVGDAIMSVFIRAGLVPSTYLLTTRGRRTGR